MIRMGLFLTIIVMTINSGLFLTGDIQSVEIFAPLSSQLNEFTDVKANTTIAPPQANVIGDSVEVEDFLGLLIGTVSTSFAIIDMIITLLTGSIQIIELVDPSHAWGLVILAPAAIIQVFYIVFMLIAILQAFAGLLRKGS